MWAAVAGSLLAVVASAEPRCVDALAVVGEVGVAVDTRRALALGPLAARPAAECAGAELRVERDAGRLHVRLARGERVVEHTVGDVSIMTSWVESWLLAETTAAPLSQVAQVVVPRGVPLELALRGVVDLDDLGPAWPGAEVAVNVGITRRVRLGVAAAAVWSIESDATLRRALRLSARVAGFPSASEIFALGCGAGIVSADAERRLTGGGVVREDDAEPFVEAFGTVRLPLGGGLALSFAAVIRGHIPDDFGPEDEPEGDPELRTLPGLSTSVQAGMVWELEAGR